MSKVEAAVIRMTCAQCGATIVVTRVRLAQPPEVPAFDVAPDFFHAGARGVFLGYARDTEGKEVILACCSSGCVERFLTTAEALEIVEPTRN